MLLKRRTLTVSEFNRYLGQSLKNDALLQHVEIEGEIGSCKLHSSGHIYFTLKDSDAKINCIIFSRDVTDKELFQEGRHLICRGGINFYEKEGNFNLIIKEAKDQGQGALYQKFLQLKSKLEEEGIFDAKYKKTLPSMPKKIGVVTSPTGAVIQDIIRVCTARFPKVEILLYPAKVQGSGAASEIICGIEYFHQTQSVDVLIVGRGGGSYEELFCFNEEELVRAIFNCSIPVISAVGHETDNSLSDYAADVRAATPSMAAELATPKLTEVVFLLENQKKQLQVSWNNKAKNAKDQITALNSRLEALSPQKMCMRMREQLFHQKKALDTQMRYNWTQAKDKMEHCKIQLKQPNISHSLQLLDWEKKQIQRTIQQYMGNIKEALEVQGRELGLLSPLESLNRGYALVFDQKKKPIFSAESLQSQDKVYIHLRDGELSATITGVNKNTRSTS